VRLKDRDPERPPPAEFPCKREDSGDARDISMVTSAKTISCTGVMIDENTVVPKMAARARMVISFLMIPKRNTTPVMSGRPSRSTVTGERRVLIGSRSPTHTQR